MTLFSMNLPHTCDYSFEVWCIYLHDIVSCLMHYIISTLMTVCILWSTPFIGVAQF